MLTYNHERYIAKALDSVLMQKTTFPFEIVLSDDGSKDCTPAICQKYAAQHPKLIRYISHEKNIGMMPNWISTIEACTGQYIAILEGDDYWTDDIKLQLQADFLDSHKDFSLCCHLHEVLIQEKLVQMRHGVNNDFITVPAEYYMRKPFFHTTSYFFRKDALPQPFPDWYYNVLAGDHFLVLFLSLKGKIGCLNRRMSVFRNHGKSVSFTRTALDIKNNFVHHLEMFDQYSEGKYHQMIQNVILKWHLVYQVYEPGSQLKRLGYFAKNLGFYVRHFRWVGGFRLMFKYFLPKALLRRLKK
jgi:glycosyltransferase involved in cell wall biosynthesis